jgi:hypothetical protein
MKKPKLLLSAIAILAMAGSVLAFRANRSQLVLFQKNAQGTLCTKRAGAFNASPGGVLMTNIYTTGASAVTTVATSRCTLNLSVAEE